MVKARSFKSTESAADFINRFVDEIISVTALGDELLVVYKS